MIITCTSRLHIFFILSDIIAVKLFTAICSFSRSPSAAPKKVVATKTMVNNSSDETNAMENTYRKITDMMIPTARIPTRALPKIDKTLSTPSINLFIQITLPSLEQRPASFQRRAIHTFICLQLHAFHPDQPGRMHPF